MTNNADQNEDITPDVTDGAEEVVEEQLEEGQDVDEEDDEVDPTDENGDEAAEDDEEEDDEEEDDEEEGEEEDQEIPQEEAKKYKAIVANLHDMAEKTPNFSQALADAVAGKLSLIEAVAITISEEDFAAIKKHGLAQDSPYVKQVKKGRKEAKERTKAEAEALQKMEVSYNAMLDFAKKKGMSDPETEEYAQKYYDFMNSWATGSLTQDQLDGIYRMLNYDKHVKEAIETGKVAGRKEGVQDRRKSAQKNTKSAGIGTIAGGGAMMGSEDVQVDPRLASFYRAIGIKPETR